jgi:hypothetical protein
MTGPPYYGPNRRKLMPLMDGTFAPLAAQCWWVRTKCTFRTKDEARLRKTLEVAVKTVLSLLLGIVLIVAGTAVLTYQGVTFTTAERQLLHVGPLQAGTQQSNWTITLPPILGAVLLISGTVLVFVIAIVKRAPKREKDLKTPAESPLIAPDTR